MHVSRINPIRTGVSFFLLLCMFVGCGSNQAKSDPQTAAGENGKKTISVVTTIFPVYDWVGEVTRGIDEVETIMLLDSGVDLHSYQPSASELITISQCDLFIYVGGESDDWAAEALKTPGNPDRRVINLLEVLGDKAIAENPESGALATGSEDLQQADESAASEWDEHVWLSLKNAALYTETIQDVLAEICPQQKDKLIDNASAYAAELEGLDQAYEAMVAEAPRKTLVFGDRFPFRYMAADYGISCYAAFSGCAAEAEASFETIAFLADKVKEEGLTSVLQCESADGKIARTICGDGRVLTMDSLQSVTAGRAEAGASYIGIMKDNMEILRQALYD